MSAEIANRQLISIAGQLAAEGETWETFLQTEDLQWVNLGDEFERIDWDHYASVMAAVERRWGLAKLAQIGEASVASEEVAAFRDGVTIQCDNLDEMMDYLFQPGGAFSSVLPCVEYTHRKIARRHWQIEMRMRPGYALSKAHCHYGVGVLRALPVLLHENVADVTVATEGDSACYSLRVSGWHPLSWLKLRFDRSRPNLDLARRVGETFTELMVRQARLQQEAERRRAVEAELAHREKLDALGRLTGSVAHDFNNLLTVVQGQLDLLKLDLSDADLVRRVEVANKATEQGAHLTRKLLAFGRRAPLQPEATNLNDIIEELMPMLASTLGETVDIHLDLADDLHDTQLDKGQLETALLNLIINARDAMPNGGGVTLQTANANPVGGLGDSASDDYVMLSLQDSGSGIAPEVLEHVFEPFFTTKEPEMGSGLGLSTVWGFVQQSGGTAQIESTQGEGTMVRLYFPDINVPVEIEEVADHAAVTPAVVPQSGARILVVEDEPDVRLVVSEMLDQIGYAVTAVDNGTRAMEEVEADSDIVLLLTDVVLPGGMSGQDVAAAMQESQPGLPVIYMSGYPDVEATRGRTFKPTDVLLPKPFTYTELSRTLEQVLNVSQAGSG